MQHPELAILIDDDNAFNMISEIMIRKFTGLQNIRKFVVPEEALSYLSTDFASQPVPCIVLLDINMPTLTGWEVLEQLETLSSQVLENLKVYIVSSSIDPDDKMKAEANPLVSGFLCKPVSKDLLTSIIAVTEKRA